MPTLKLLLHLSFATLYLSVLMEVQASNLQFSYYPNITGDHDSDFIFSPSSNLASGALQVTIDSRNSPLADQAGRVVYGKTTLRLWGDKKADAASFNTTFVLNILAVTNPGGEGLAFILTTNSTVPSNSYGKWLGIVNKETNGSPPNQVVAIEFDTRKSYLGDIDSNHVGVDVNSINSTFQFPLDRSIVNLSSGNDVLVKINYDGKLGNMTVDLSMVNETTFQNSLSFQFPLNLTEYLPKDVYVGFSASTSNFTQLNCVKSWNFTSSKIGKGTWGPLKWVLPVSIGVPTLLAAASVVLLCCVCRKRKRHADLVRNGSAIGLFHIEGSKQFRLKELTTATSNFHPSRILGRGGFGIVYRGTLKGIEVAIKRFSMNSCQGEKEFFSEVNTIGRLHHPNLVKLIGWCNERGELLLVYQYLPKGSLDKLLFPSESTTVLSWAQRFKILKDVASALNHLHDEAHHNLIFHKDVKSSNIMLDSVFNAYLGDFGLARTVEEGNSHHTTKIIAGTSCYVAPEYCETGRASIKTDVYAFGALAVEVCCGEKPIQNRTLPWDNSVINRVLELYKDDKISEAADLRLAGEFDRPQMELVLKLALLCCQYNEVHRPTSSLVLKVLMGEEDLPDLPSALTDTSPGLQEHLDEEEGTFANTEIIGR